MSWVCRSDGRSCAEEVLRWDVALTRLGNVALALFRDISVAISGVSQKREPAQTSWQLRNILGIPNQTTV